MPSSLDELLTAALGLRTRYRAEVERLKSGADWQPRWKAEQKALAADKICQAIMDITSKGNSNEDRNHGA